MSRTQSPGATHGAHAPGKVGEVMMAVAMSVGRGAAARALAEIAGLTAEDRLVDVGCGPGAAVREAARRGAAATGIDPSAVSLVLARRIAARANQGSGSVLFRQGRAEALPLPDASATVVWSLSSVHHWQNPAAGFAEIYRVLAPGGRLVIAERLVRPGGRGPAAHGLSRDRADEFARELAAIGFAGAGTRLTRVRRTTMILIEARRPVSPDPDQP